MSIPGLGRLGLVTLGLQFSCFFQVRIEDDIIVTADGMELMTQVPRTVQEIEEHMQGGAVCS